MKISTLNNLIKISQHNLDQKRKILKHIYDKKDFILNKINEIEDILENETASISKFTGESGDYIKEYFPIFKQNVTDQIVQLNEESKKVDPEIEEISTQISEAFIELKRYELIRDNKIEQESREREKKNQQELDEISIEKFRRDQL